MRGLTLGPGMARRPVLITMIINGRKLSAMPIRAGRSAAATRGCVRASCGRLYGRKHPRRFWSTVPLKLLAEVIENVGVRRSVSPKREQRFPPKLGGEAAPAVQWGRSAGEIDDIVVKAGAFWRPRS